MPNPSSPRRRDISHDRPVPCALPVAVLQLHGQHPRVLVVHGSEAVCLCRRQPSAATRSSIGREQVSSESSLVLARAETTASCTLMCSWADGSHHGPLASWPATWPRGIRALPPTHLPVRHGACDGDAGHGGDSEREGREPPLLHQRHHLRRKEREEGRGGGVRRHIHRESISNMGSRDCRARLGEALRALPCVFARHRSLLVMTTSPRIPLLLERAHAKASAPTHHGLACYACDMRVADLPLPVPWPRAAWRCRAGSRCRRPREGTPAAHPS